MRRLVQLASLALCVLGCVYTAAGQNVVTGTIHDPQGNPYANGNASAFLAVVSGQTQPPSTNVTTNAAGFFTMTLATGSYSFTICAAPSQLPPVNPVANPTPRQVCFQSAPVSISSNPQDVSATLNAIAVSLGPQGSQSGGSQTLSSLNNIIFVDGVTYPCTVAGYGLAQTAALSGSQEVDIRSCASIPITQATGQLTLGAANKSITVRYSRATSFPCSITDGVSDCIHQDGGVTFEGDGTVAYPNSGVLLSGTANVAHGYILENDTGSNQVGGYVSGLMVRGASGAVAADSLCADKDTFQLVVWYNVTCSASGMMSVVVHKIYASASGKLVTNPVMLNDQMDGGNGAGNYPCWVGGTASGSLTGTHLGTGAVYAVNFIGGICVNPGTGLPALTVTGTDGAGGSNLIGQVYLSGLQLQVGHNTDIGMEFDGVTVGATANGVTVECSIASCGGDTVKMTQPAGTLLDGINMDGVSAGGVWTGNTFNNTVISDTVTNAQCANGCRYRYQKNAANYVSQVYADGNSRLETIDANGVHANRMHLLDASNAITSAPPNSAAGNVGWKECIFTNTYCVGLASNTEVHQLPVTSWLSIFAGTTFPAGNGSNSAPDTNSIISLGSNGSGLAKLWVANQGTALTNGAIALGAGWGTGAAPTVCTGPGWTNTGCFTITSGSASFGAAPTVTITLPNALPSANTPCTLDVHAITGAGGAIIFDETTFSATAPVFTATTSTGAAFTPAVTETYKVVLRCGP